jgi:hypothetical protein
MTAEMRARPVEGLGQPTVHVRSPNRRTVEYPLLGAPGSVEVGLARHVALGDTAVSVGPVTVPPKLRRSGMGSALAEVSYTSARTAGFRHLAIDVDHDGAVVWPMVAHSRGVAITWDPSKPNAVVEMLVAGVRRWLSSSGPIEPVEDLLIQLGGLFPPRPDALEDARWNWRRRVRRTISGPVWFLRLPDAPRIIGPDGKTTMPLREVLLRAPGGWHGVIAL